MTLARYLTYLFLMNDFLCLWSTLKKKASGFFTGILPKSMSKKASKCMCVILETSVLYPVALH